MGFGSEIAKLLASIDLDTRPFEKGAGRVSGDLSKMEGGFSRISTRATALGTAVGIGIERLAEKGIDVLFGAIQSGEDSLRQLQNVQAQTTAVIQSTGGAAGVTAQQVRDLAEQTESLTTADDKAVQNAANLLLTFTGIGKDAFPAATKAVVDLGIAMNGGNAEGVDFSKTAVQIGKALNDPILGLTALRKVGVSFSEDQIKRIKQLQKEGDLYGAQKIVLAELEKEFGKAGEAAGKSGGAGVVRLNDAVEDLQISLAEGLSPALTEIRSDLAKGLEDPKTQQAVRDLGRFLGDAATSGIAFAKTIPWGQVADGLKTAAGFAGKLIDIFAHLPPGVQGTIISLAALNKLGGGGVIRIGVDLFKQGAQGLLGKLFDRGSSPANPMFVVDAGGTLGGAVPGVAKGGIGAVGKLFLVGEAIGLIAAVNEVRDGIAGQLTEQATGIHNAVSQQINDAKTTSAQLAQSLAGVEQGIEALSHDPIGNALLGDQLSELQRMRDELSSALVKLDDTNKANFRNSERDDRSNTSTTKQAVDQAQDAIESSRIALSTRLGETRQAVETGSRAIVGAIEDIPKPPSLGPLLDALDRQPKLQTPLPITWTGTSPVPIKWTGTSPIPINALPITDAINRLGIATLKGADAGDIVDAITETSTSIVDAILSLKQVAPGVHVSPSGMVWKPSDKIQVEDRRTKPVLDNQVKVLDAVRTRLEDSERQLTTKQQATTFKVGDLQRTTASGTSEIVSAINNIPTPTTNITVIVKDGSVTTSSSFVTGQTGRPSGPGHSGI